MKNLRIGCIALFISIIGINILDAQVNGMSFNGSTGLFSVPSARIGWEGSNRFGPDMGYHAIITEGNVSHIPKMSMSLFNTVEFHGAFDIQPDGYITNTNGSDLILGAKIQVPLASTFIAFGGNYQRLNLTNDNYSHNAGQIYIALSYPGQLFNSPAETTVVLGKTFTDGDIDSDIDFGMGFSLVVLPRHLGGFVIWVTDFSNFSYSVEPFGADAWYRGSINSGFRFDFSIVPIFRRLRFAVDILITDALDSNRGFSAGVVLGVPFL